MSSLRLARIRDALQADIDKGVVPGAVALVIRRGQIASLDTLGYRDREASSTMKLDAIFRIASMTKPFTSVAAMMLAEEGRLLIADPVSRFIPEFADLQVAVDSDDRSASKPKTEPSRREMNVHDLLRHTSGLTYAHLTGPLLKSRYEGASVVDEKQTNAEMVGKLGRLPLAYQPGTTWQYGVSTDVLGRVVEVASGMELDRFIAERICKPLGLSNTGFGPIDEARAAQPQTDRASGKRPPMRTISVRPRWISGGSGLLSTAGDYARFAQMLLNGGELGGTVIAVEPGGVQERKRVEDAQGVADGHLLRRRRLAVQLHDPQPRGALAEGLSAAGALEAEEVPEEDRQPENRRCSEVVDRLDEHARDDAQNDPVDEQRSRACAQGAVGCETQGGDGLRHPRP